MATRRDWAIGLVIAGTFVVFAAALYLAASGVGETDGVGFGGFGKRVAVVDLVGTIESSRSVVQQLRRWGDDGSVPVILLRVDSPGGGVAVSQEIYNEVLRVRKKGKKVVVSMGSVAASGGLYVAVAADTIVANPGTITGSIGVITQFPTMERLFEKIGIRYETIKSGPYKDMGNLARSMSPADSASLQAVIDDSYEQFVEVVATGRRMTVDSVKMLADGRVFTGRQALQLHLVDVLGDYYDALDIAADMGGLDKPPRTVREIPRTRRTIWDYMGQALVGWALQGSDALDDNPPSLQYRWSY
jgi:protease-4